MEEGWLWMLSLVVGMFVLIFVRRMNGWYYDIKLMKKRQQYPLPPGDMGWPLIGNFLAFYRAFTSGLPDSFLNNFISKYGKKGIYKTHLFGQPTIIVSTSELCREVLKDEQRFQMNYTKSANELVLRSNRFVNMEEHKRFRQNILSPIMGQNALSVYMERIEHIVINSLESMANSSHPVELFTEAAKVSFNTILHITLGPENEAFIKQLEDLFHVMHKGLFSMAIDLPGFAFHEAIKARKKAEQILQLVVDVRKDRIKGGHQQKTKKDLIDNILEIKYDNGCKLEDENIIDLIIGLVFGGQMTTAGAITWAIISLLKNPHLMKKAKEEQEEIMKARPPSQKHLDIKEIKQMVYLAKVINEMLRRCTPTSFIFREATVDTDINGYLIPRGWKVMSYVRGVHMDPENHPNPEEFNPSRSDDYKAKGAFLPFGSGSRTCAGNELARLQIAIFLHHFLLGYKFERVNPECLVTYLPLAMPKDKCLIEVSKL